MDVIPSGMLLIVSHGEYSDYSPLILGRALVDIDPLALKETYLETRPYQRQKGKFYARSFAKWLFDEGYIEPYDYMELGLGVYDNGKFAIYQGTNTMREGAWYY